MGITSLGVNRIQTTREHRTWTAAGIGVIVAAAIGTWLGVIASSMVTGTGRPHVQFRAPWTGEGHLFQSAAKSKEPFRLQSPVTFDVPPVHLVIVAVVAVLFVAAVVMLILRPIVRAASPVARDQGLATKHSIRKALGKRQARKAAKYTLPGTTWWQRRLLPMQAFAVNIGQAVKPDGGDLWVDAEKKIRIVARSGWGKTQRLLVPIIRQQTGAAMVSSIEPSIFLDTVTAREWRWPNGRRRVGLRVAPPNPFRGFEPWFKRIERLRRRHYPVAVVDCSREGMTPATAKYPTVHWNPIPGCENFAVATRRATALVKGINPSGSDSSSEVTVFFEDSAAQVLAAWLHAGAFDKSVEVQTLQRWLETGNTHDSENILRANAAYADPSALPTMLVHMDPKGERTTSGVKRYLVMVMQSLTSLLAQDVVGSRNDPSFDFHQLIRDEGTLYLLAEPKEMETVRPLLALLASEFAYAAVDIARNETGDARRLPRTCWLNLDEILFGIRLAILPEVANTWRKFGISYITSATNDRDEEALYGPEAAQLLRGQAGVTIYGGFTEDSHEQLTAKAGPVTVVTATKGTGRRDSSETERDALRADDIQILEDGQSVIDCQGVRPFVARTRSVYERRWLKRRIARERRELVA